MAAISNLQDSGFFVTFAIFVIFVKHGGRHEKQQD
jgi:hypothetical protein